MAITDTARPGATGARLRRATAAVDSRLRELVARPALAALLLAAVITAMAAFAHTGLEAPLRTDYVAMLTGARLLAEHGCLYCAGSQLATQRLLLHAATPAFDPFLEGPLTALAFVPLLRLSSEAGFAILLGASTLAALAAATVLWRGLGLRRHGVTGAALLAVAIWSLPAGWNAALGQTDALLLLPAAAGTVLLHRNRPLAAGIVLSLLLLKPQTAWLVPVVLLATGQRRAATGLVAGGITLAAADLALAGPSAVQSWLALAAGRGPELATGLGLPAAAAAIAGLPGALAVAGTAAAGAAWVVWRWRRQLVGKAAVVISLGLAASALAAPHLYAYDLVILAVPIAVLGIRRPGLALGVAMLLDVAHAVDSYLLPTGLHAETVVVLGLGAALAAGAVLPAGHMPGVASRRRQPAGQPAGLSRAGAASR